MGVHVDVMISINEEVGLPAVIIASGTFLVLAAKARLIAAKARLKRIIGTIIRNAEAERRSGNSQHALDSVTNTNPDLMLSDPPYVRHREFPRGIRIRHHIARLLRRERESD
jgi:hypothetical protein